MSPQMTFFEILISTIRYGQEFQKDVSEETCGIDSESEFKNVKNIEKCRKMDENLRMWHPKCSNRRRLRPKMDGLPE